MRRIQMWIWMLAWLRMIIWMLDFRASKNIPKRTTYDEGSGGSERMDGPTYL